MDSLYPTHHRESVYLEEVSASISIIDALDEKLKITSVSTKKGHITIFVDENQYANTYVFEANSTKKNNHLKLINNDIDIIIEDIDFTFIEKTKNKRITAHVNKIDFNIDAEKTAIQTINLDVLMKEMGLNLEKGIFFNNARCVGNFHPKIDMNSTLIEVPKFSLKIAEQDFEVSADFNLKDKLYSFLIALDDANYNETNQLMAANIKDRLEPFDILNPFDVKAKISGKFEYLSNTLVELEFETFNNKILYKKDSLTFKNISFNGSFINRKFKGQTKIENRKNYTFSFTNLNGEFNNIPFKLTETSLSNEFTKPVYLTSLFEVEGNTKDLNELINSSDFYFTRGTFIINGNYNGVLNSISDIIESSEATLDVKNLIIKSKNNPSRFKIPELALKIDHNNAKIKNLVVEFDAKELVKINGFINNFGNLISNFKVTNPTVSSLSISSDYLNFNSLLKSFGAIEKNNPSINLYQVKKSTIILASKFNPSINFNFKKLIFFDVPFNNINIDANYKNNEIYFPNISGNYKAGEAQATINIDLNPKENTRKEEVLKLDLALIINGKIEHWAEMLHNEKFFFQDANYHLELNYNNETNNLAELINHSTIDLNVNEGSMLYKPASLTLPFNNISLSIKNKTAFLNDFELSLPNNQSLHLKGEVTNFIEIFDKSLSTKNITSTITVSSQNVDFSNFMDTFNPDSQKTIKKNKVKSILTDLYSNFKLSLHLDLENLKYKNVTLEKVNASLLFKNQNTLYIKDASCFFYGKEMTLTTEIDISQNTTTHFTTYFTLDNFAIENLLYTFDNFGYNKLDSPTQLTGIINLKANFSGIIDDTEGVDYNSLEADMNYNIKELDVRNFQPIIDAGNKVFRKKRFENIKFANINSTLILKNNTITIPETNVQSSAFDFFIEGDLDNTSQTDLWISIPLSNLKRRDLAKVPSKKDYEESGKKIYLEIKANEEGDLEHKVFLRNKKHLSKQE